MSLIANLIADKKRERRTFSGGLQIENVNPTPDRVRRPFYDVHNDRNQMFAQIYEGIARSDDFGKTWRKVYDLPGYAVNNIYVTHTGNVLVWCNEEGAKPPALIRINPELTSHDVVIDSSQSPRPPFHTTVSVAEHNGVIMYSEYVTGTFTERRIWKSVDDGVTWNVVHEDLEIRHWHSLNVDPHTGHWWAGAGDTNSESRIVKSTDNGVTWEVVASGSQDVRIIGMVFFENFLIYATDVGTAGSKNHIWKSPKNVWKPERVSPIVGPCYGCFKSRDGRAIIYTFGEQREFSVIYSTDGYTTKEIFRTSRITRNITHGGINYMTNVDNENRCLMHTWRSTFGGDGVRISSVLLPFENSTKDIIVTEWVGVSDISGIGTETVNSNTIAVDIDNLQFSADIPMIEVRFTPRVTVGDGSARVSTWLRVFQFHVTDTAGSADTGASDKYFGRLLGGLTPFERVIRIKPTVWQPSASSDSNTLRMRVESKGVAEGTEWEVTDIKARLIYQKL